MRSNTRTTVFVIAGVLALACVCAANVVVKPSNMNGWVLATITSANPTPGYPGISTGFVDPEPRGLGRGDIGVGAFYASLGGDGSTSAGPYPGQVWLGTNAYSGVALDNIADIEWHAWTCNGGIWNNNSKYWAPPRQPLGLRLVIKEASPSTVTRMLIWRPWNEGSPAGFGKNDYYPDDNAYLETWKIHNPTTGGLWIDYTWNVGVVWSGDWQGLRARYPGATIATPAVQVGGQWPEATPVNTPNGCGLSLQWGAEMYGTSSILPDANPPKVPYVSWWRETINGACYVDCFEIDAGAGYETYDFESDTPGRLLASNTNATQDAGGKAAYYGHVNMERRVVGKVIAQDITKNWNVTHMIASPHVKEFILDDGGVKIRVFCPGNSVAVDQWYAVTGKIMPATSMYVSGTPRSMRLHATVDDLQLISP